MRLTSRNPGQSTLAEEAVRLAADLWPIFPLKPRGKAPLTEHGFQDATTDPDVAAAWWRRWPNANIGLHCRNFAVLDVDPRNGGDASLEKLVAEHGPEFKDTVNVLTGGGGVHYYYRGSTAVSHAGEGLDVKSQGGYVILPPSVHPSGKSYAWEYEPGEVDMLELPLWLKHRKNPQTAKIYEQRPIPAGDRNDTLVRLSGRLRALGGYLSDVSVIEAALAEINQRYCEPPLNDDEIRALAETAKRWTPGSNSYQGMENVEW